MAWWNRIANGVGSILQPSLKFSFKVEFVVFNPDYGSSRISYRVKDVTLPSFQKNVESVLLGNKMVRQEGTIQWQPIKISFYDTDLIEGNARLFESIAFGLFNTGRMLHDDNLDFGYYAESTFGVESALSTVNTDLSTNSIVFSSIRIYKLFGQQRSFMAGTDDVGQPNFEEGQHAHVFHISKPILTGINFGDLDYSSEESNLITLDIEYDSCDMYKETYK